MSKRCGSYPLMNLAADYGVAYGDVLLMADVERRRRVGDEFTDGRCDVALAAAERSAIHATDGDFGGLYDAILDHADARWGDL